jgi:hypothetical protein
MKPKSEPGLRLAGHGCDSRGWLAQPQCSAETPGIEHPTRSERVIFDLGTSPGCDVDRSLALALILHLALPGDRCRTVQTSLGRATATAVSTTPLFVAAGRRGAAAANKETAGHVVPTAGETDCRSLLSSRLHAVAALHLNRGRSLDDGRPSRALFFGSHCSLAGRQCFGRR